MKGEQKARNKEFDMVGEKAIFHSGIMSNSLQVVAKGLGLKMQQSQKGDAKIKL